MVCGVDLWDVDRSITAGSVVMCSRCVDAVKTAMDEATDSGNIEIRLAPRVHGSAPDPDAPQAVAQAFQSTFGSGGDRSGESLEDSEELIPLLEQASTKFGPMTQFRVRVEAMRFPTPNSAEVRFQVLLNAGPGGIPFQGAAIRDGGRWLVTRETVRDVLARGGVHVPDRGASGGYRRG